MFKEWPGNADDINFVGKVRATRAGARTLNQEYLKIFDFYRCSGACAAVAEIYEEICESFVIFMEA